MPAGSIDWQSPLCLAQQPRCPLQPLGGCQPTLTSGMGWFTTSNMQCVIMSSYRWLFPALCRISSCYVPVTLERWQSVTIAWGWSSDDWTYCLHCFFLSFMTLLKSCLTLSFLPVKTNDGVLLISWRFLFLAYNKLLLSPQYGNFSNSLQNCKNGVICGGVVMAG